MGRDAQCCNDGGGGREGELLLGLNGTVRVVMLGDRERGRKEVTEGKKERGQER